MANKRVGISKKIRFEVFKRDSFSCQYCGASAPTVVLHADHIIPVSKGGETDILNLVTSCQPCNAGKSGVLLSDNSAVTKQKAQLDELNERREQLDMMLQRRQGLKSIDNLEYQAAFDAWHDATGLFLSDSGLASLKKLVKKFGLKIVLDGAEVAGQYVTHDGDGATNMASGEIAFKKLGGICKNLSEPPWKQELIHCKNIAAKRLNYCNGWQLMEWMTTAYQEGHATTDELKEIVLSSTTWTSLRERLAYIMGSK